VCVWICVVCVFVWVCESCMCVVCVFVWCVYVWCVGVCVWCAYVSVWCVVFLLDYILLLLLLLQHAPLHCVLLHARFVFFTFTWLFVESFS